MKSWFFVLAVLLGLTLTSCSNPNQAAKPDEPQQQEQAQKENSREQHVTYGEQQNSLSSDISQAAYDSGNDSVNPGSVQAASEQIDSMMLDIPILNQNPELKYGCEVTSLAMVLQYAGVATDKLKLADELPKDNDPVQKTKSGDITSWGNPDHGFVGDVTGKSAGFAIYAAPLETLMKRYLPDRTVNLTRKPFDEVVAQIKNGKPVILWTTGDYKIPDRWESWKHGTETINTPLDLHAVVLVGFDKEHLYLNDPLTGKKVQKTKKDSFLESWNALGQQALSYN